MTADERVALTLERSRCRRLPLAAVVIPTPSRTISEVHVERLSPGVALPALLSTPRIHGWQRPDVLSRDFSALGEVVDHVPIYEVTIPWGPPFPPSVARVLAGLASDLT
jgi:hypothetical protein